MLMVVLMFVGYGQVGFAAVNEKRPNIVLIFCDDLGNADISCQGSEWQHTPNIDKLAEEGSRFTSFYVTSGVCTPSRSSLMTGCYPRRVNMHLGDGNAWVLFPGMHKGLNPDEVTVAEVLKSKGYRTACIGKWHLGDQPEFLPTRQGFDTYFGIPYSNDMGHLPRPRGNYPKTPLLRDEKVIEAEPDQRYITRRYTDEVISFIKESKDEPFFVYWAHTFPHWPHYSSPAFAGKSRNTKNQAFGDCVEELDWSVGQLMGALKALGLDENTLVIFTSDNGGAPGHGALNLPYSGGKGTTLEGGQRVPFIARWKGKIPAGRVDDTLISSIDILPTFAKLVGAKLDEDRVIDGKDISPILMGEEGAKTPHEAFYYYFKDNLECVRSGDWKLRVKHIRNKKFKGPALFNLKDDIAETKNLVEQHPEVVKRLAVLVEKARKDLGDGKLKGAGQRPAGRVENAKTLLPRPPRNKK